jgi:hypothetical protein
MDYASIETKLQEELIGIQEEIRVKAAEGKLPHPTWGERFVLSKQAPWLDMAVELNIVNMLSKEDAQYISYISQKIPANSHVLELGPWLGMSTNLVLRNANKIASMTIVDDFIWRSIWMQRYLPSSNLLNGESFLNLFCEINKSVIDELSLQEAKIQEFSDNQHLDFFKPGIEPYSLVLVDCGRNFQVNETWWNVLKANLIPGETLIVLQDYCTHKEVPFKWYNEMKNFVDSKEDSLDQIHELRNGGVASFVFMG